MCAAAMRAKKEEKILLKHRSRFITKPSALAFGNVLGCCDVLCSASNTENTTSRSSHCAFSHESYGFARATLHTRSFVIFHIELHVLGGPHTRKMDFFFLVVRASIRYNMRREIERWRGGEGERQKERYDGTVRL